jgi:hypothetical protein
VSSSGRAVLSAEKLEQLPGCLGARIIGKVELTFGNKGSSTSAEAIAFGF